MLVMSYRNPKPAKIKAVQPPTPTAVIQKRLLYRKTFRNVSFPIKPMRFHNHGIRSNKIRFPDFGGFGRISCAGCSRRAFRQAIALDRQVQSSPTPKQASADFQRNGHGMSCR